MLWGYSGTYPSMLWGYPGTYPSKVNILRVIPGYIPKPNTLGAPRYIPKHDPTNQAWYPGTFRVVYTLPGTTQTPKKMLSEPTAGR